MNYYLLLAMLTFPLPVIVGFLLFKDRSEFFGAIRSIVLPDYIPDVGDESVEDDWITLKLFLLPIVWVAAATSAHMKWQESIQRLAESVFG